MSNVSVCQRRRHTEKFKRRQRAPFVLSVFMRAWAKRQKCRRRHNTRRARARARRCARALAFVLFLLFAARLEVVPCRSILPRHLSLYAACFREMMPNACPSATGRRVLLCLLCLFFCCLSISKEQPTPQRREETEMSLSHDKVLLPAMPRHVFVFAQDFRCFTEGVRGQ